MGRITITASCPMNLKYFPLDSQLCPVEIESCTYNSCFICIMKKKRKKTTFLCPGAWNEISLRVCWDVCVFLVDNVSKLMKRNGRQQHCDPYSGVSLQSASRRARFGTNGWTDRRPSPSSPKWNCPSSRSWDTVNGPTFTVWLPVKHKSFSLFILVFHSRKKKRRKSF